MVSVRWTGAAGLEFTYRDQTILIDPYHSRPGKFEIFFLPVRSRSSAVENYLEKLPGRLSAIIVSHTHLDHALDISEFARRYEGPLLGSQSLDELLKINHQSGRTCICKGLKHIKLNENTIVTMIPSRHGLVAFGKVPYPGEIIPTKFRFKASDYRHGMVFIPKLEFGGITFMHLGSANFIASELKGHQCDVLFMCVPGWKKISGYTNQLLEIIKPKIIVPFHFDDFSAPLPINKVARNLPFQDMSGFQRQIKKTLPQVEFRIPVTYQPINF